MEGVVLGVSVDGGARLFDVVVVCGAAVPLLSVIVCPLGGSQLLEWEWEASFDTAAGSVSTGSGK